MIRLLATGCYSGLAPFAPGTFGSLFACALGWLILSQWGFGAFAVATLLACTLGVWVSHAYLARYAHSDDPKEVVIDEIAGQWLCFFVCAALVGYVTQSPEALRYLMLRMLDEPLIWLAGFISFRVFDVIKPWPVSWADAQIGGGLGIMLDDLLAGVLAGCMVFAMLSIAPLFLLSPQVLP